MHYRGVAAGYRFWGKGMKTRISLALAVALATTLVCATTITEKNAEKANVIIELAVAAHGGSLGLDALHTLIVESERVNYAVNQSRGTEPPWDQNNSTDISAIDLKNPAYVNRNVASGFAFQGDNGTIINAEESYQLDYRTGTVAKIAEPDFDTASGPFVRVTPGLLVRELQQRAGNAHYLGEGTIDGKEHDVVAFSMTVGPAISLYFDKKNHMLRRSERIFPGLGLLRYEFDEYQNVNGMPMNRIFRFYLNGDKQAEQVNVSTRINEPLAPLMVVDKRLQSIPQLEPDPLNRQEISDGVWLIGGNGGYAMYIDMDDYIFAAGGAADIPAGLELLREVAGDKPLRYGMLTHHHFDHVVSVAGYEAAGATVITASAHELIARGAAESGDTLNVKTVDKRMTLESGKRTLHVIDIGPTAHTEHLLVAYLPDEGILFEADHFSLPTAGPVRPATQSTRSFAEALARNELAVTRIYSAHSRRAGTLDDLQAALDAELFQASR